MMMGNFNVGSMGFFGATGILLYILFWIGVASLAYYFVAKAKDDKEKVFLTLGLILVLGSIFLATLLGTAFGGSMMGRKAMWQSGMMQGAMKEMMKDDSIRDDMREMMEEVEQEK